MEKAGYRRAQSDPGGPKSQTLRRKKRVGEGLLIVES